MVDKVSGANFRRSQVKLYPLDRTSRKVDTAHVLSVTDGNVLYNIEAADGTKYLHRILPLNEFDARWFLPETRGTLADALDKAA